MHIYMYVCTYVNMAVTRMKEKLTIRGRKTVHWNGFHHTHQSRHNELTIGACTIIEPCLRTRHQHTAANILYHFPKGILLAKSTSPQVTIMYVRNAYMYELICTDGKRNCTPSNCWGHNWLCRSQQQALCCGVGGKEGSNHELMINWNWILALI